MDPSAVALIIGAVLGTGGFGALILNFRKAGKEAEAVVTARVISINDELRLELDRRDKAHMEELERLETRRLAEAARYREEIAQLRERIARLEAAP